MIIDERMREVIRLVCLGKTNGDIGKYLGISASRVKKYVGDPDFKVALEIYDKEVRNLTSDFRMRLDIMANESLTQTYDRMKTTDSEAIAQRDNHFLIDKHVDVSGIGQSKGVVINLQFGEKEMKLVRETLNEIKETPPLQAIVEPIEAEVVRV